MTPDTNLMDVILGVASFALNILILGIGGVWKLSRVQGAIRDLISDHRSESDEKFLGLRREFGEVGAALRQKIVEVEFYMRDNFVRTEAFSQALTAIDTNINTLGERIEARLLRMEEKQDSAVSNTRARRTMTDKD